MDVHEYGVRMGVMVSLKNVLNEPLTFMVSCSERMASDQWTMDATGEECYYAEINYAGGIIGIKYVC